jgi:hypothetical protein
MNNLKIKSLKDKANAQGFLRMYRLGSSKANAQGFLSMYRLGSTGHLCTINKMRPIHPKLAV